MKEKFYITTAISYPNGPPHIGHAYEVLATDALARFKRLDGYDVMFLTGTDEHGQKIEQTARKQGRTPPISSTRWRRSSRTWWRCSAARMMISSAPRMRATRTRSPNCGSGSSGPATSICRTMPAGIRCATKPSTATDEIEDRDGKKFSTKTGTPVEWVEEASYFFRLSAYQDKLLKLYADQPDFIGPAERRNEVVSFVKGGLQDLSVSRTTFDWGIPVPGAPRPHHVCVARCAHQLSLRHRMAGRRARATITGRPISISSARTSCASTPSIGRPS